MTTKYNHEYEVNTSRRILDPIGKLAFNSSLEANQEGDLHILDLAKSSNHIVVINNYDNNTNWIQFNNLSNIHRYDLAVQVRNNDHTPGNIYFGNGSLRYEEPQFGVGSLSPKLFWIHNNPYSLLENIKTNLFTPSAPSNNTDLFVTNNLTIIYNIIQIDGNPVPDPENYGFAGQFDIYDEGDQLVEEVGIYTEHTVEGSYVNSSFPMGAYYIHMPNSYIIKYNPFLSDWEYTEFTRYWRFIDMEYMNCNFTFRYGNVPILGDHVIGYLSSSNLIPQLLPNNQIIIEVQFKVPTIT